MAKDFEPFLDTFASVSFLVSLEIDAKFLGYGLRNRRCHLGSSLECLARVSRASRPPKNSTRLKVHLFYGLPSFQRKTTHLHAYKLGDRSASDEEWGHKLHVYPGLERGVLQLSCVSFVK